MENNLRCTITVGIPGSGKTTWAKNYATEYDNYMRISKDDLRYMVKNKAFLNSSEEALISTLVDTMAVNLTDKGYNIIIDATNVNLSDLFRYIDLLQYRCDIAFMVFNTPLDECLRRNALRAKPIPENVIRNKFADYTVLHSQFDFKTRYKKTI